MRRFAMAGGYVIPAIIIVSNCEHIVWVDIAYCMYVCMYVLHIKRL